MEARIGHELARWRIWKWIGKVRLNYRLSFPRPNLQLVPHQTLKFSFDKKCASSTGHHRRNNEKHCHLAYAWAFGVADSAFTEAAAQAYPSQDIHMIVGFAPEVAPT